MKRKDLKPGTVFHYETDWGALFYVDAWDPAAGAPPPMCYQSFPSQSDLELDVRVHWAPSVVEPEDLTKGPVWRPETSKPVGLPVDYETRKKLPVFRGPVMYFPDALLAVAAVCEAGNKQHNPGEPLHWAREKSTEHMDTAMRHMMDHGLGNTKDTDGTYHLAKAAWRLLAELQLTIEREHAASSAGSK